MYVFVRAEPEKNVTDEGSVRGRSEEQVEKTPRSILEIRQPASNVIIASCWQPEKVSSPSDSTERGMKIRHKERHLANARFSITERWESDSKATFERVLQARKQSLQRRVIECGRQSERIEEFRSPRIKRSLAQVSRPATSWTSSEKPEIETTLRTFTTSLEGRTPALTESSSNWFNQFGCTEHRQH
jgi:hypothetical protein